MKNTTEQVRCLIIGSGPAGYTAAIYTSRADLRPVLYEGLQPGGQLTITTEIENFPGYPNGVSGGEMMKHLKAQTERFNADIRQGIIVEADFTQRPYTLTDDKGHKILAEAVIIATGASAKWLGLPAETKFMGQGVSACATCDGFFYRGQTVAVVGGGDTACEEATYLSKICEKVYLIVRRNELRASKTMQYRVMNDPKIEVLWNHVTEDILGDHSGVHGAKLKNVKTNAVRDIEITGFFVAIGHEPNVEVFKGQINLDENNYILTKPGTTQTNKPGVFAAGDVQDPHFRQAITASGSGCMAAIELERFLNNCE